MGGVAKNVFIEGVTTHLVTTGCSTDSLKYRAAVAHKIPAVSLEWIDSAWDTAQAHDIFFFATDDAFVETFKLPLFTNCVVSVSGYKPHERAEIKELVEANGGIFSGDLRRDVCTHLVTDATSGEKFKRAVEWNMKIIQISWLRKSVSQGYRLPEERFRPGQQPTCSTPERRSVELPPLNMTEVSIIKRPSDVGADGACAMANASAQIVNTSVTFLHPGCQNVRRLGVAPASSTSQSRCVSGVSRVQETVQISQSTHAQQQTTVADSSRGTTVATGDSSRITSETVQDSINNTRAKSAFSTTADDSFNQPFEAAGETAPSKSHLEQRSTSSVSLRQSQLNAGSNSSSRMLETARHAETPNMLSRGVTPANASRLESTMHASSMQTSQLKSQDQSQRARQLRTILQGKTVRVGHTADPQSQSVHYMVRQCGGTIVEDDNAHADFYLVPLLETDDELLVERVRCQHICSIAWLQACEREGRLLDPSSNPLYKPILGPLETNKLFHGCVVALSGFDVHSKVTFTELLNIYGATVQHTMVNADRGDLVRNTHVIAMSESERLATARTWDLHVLDPSWVIESIIRGTRLPETGFDFTGQCYASYERTDIVWATNWQERIQAMDEVVNDSENFVEPQANAAPSAPFHVNDPTQPYMQRAALAESNAQLAPRGGIYNVDLSCSPKNYFAGNRPFHLGFGNSRELQDHFRNMPSQASFNVSGLMTVSAVGRALDAAVQQTDPLHGPTATQVARHLQTRQPANVSTQFTRGSQLTTSQRLNLPRSRYTPSTQDTDDTTRRLAEAVQKLKTKYGDDPSSTSAELTQKSWNPEAEFTPTANNTRVNSRLSAVEDSPKGPVVSWRDGGETDVEQFLVDSEGVALGPASVRRPTETAASSQAPLSPISASLRFGTPLKPNGDLNGAAPKAKPVMRPLPTAIPEETERENPGDAEVNHIDDTFGGDVSSVLRPPGKIPEPSGRTAATGGNLAVDDEQVEDSISGDVAVSDVPAKTPATVINFVATAAATKTSPAKRAAVPLVQIDDEDDGPWLSKPNTQAHKTQPQANKTTGVATIARGRITKAVSRQSPVKRTSTESPPVEADAPPKKKANSPPVEEARLEAARVDNDNSRTVLAGATSTSRSGSRAEERPGTSTRNPVVPVPRSDIPFRSMMSAKQICFTSFEAEERQRLVDIIEKQSSLTAMCGTEFSHATTHLICGGLPQRNEKLLCALAAGKWVLTKDYITRSAAVGYWLPEKEFEFGSHTHMQAANYRNDLQKKLALACRRWRLKLEKVHSPTMKGAFARWKVLLYAKDSRAKSLCRILEYGCGKPVLREMHRGSGFVGFTHALVDVGSGWNEEELLMLATAGVKCFTVDYLSTYLVEDNPREEDSYHKDYRKYLANNP